MAKNYYGVYFIKDKSTFILEDKNELNLQTYGRSNLCRKFSTKEEAKEWLKQVKEQEKNLSPDSKSERYYAIYYVKTNIFDIVTSLEQAQKLMKGKYNLSKKFSSKEKAEEWLEIVKDKKENVFLPKKKERYYAIYYVETNTFDIITSLEQAQKLRKGKHNLSKKFSSKEKAEEWLNKVKEQELSPDNKEEAKEWLKQVQKQEKNLSPDNKSERYYAIYYVETNTFDIVTSPEEAQKLRKGKHNLFKKFSSKEKAEEWLKTVKDKKVNILLNIKKEVYYAILFLDNFDSLITNENEEKDRIILNRKYVLKSFNCELECKLWIRIMKDYHKKNYNCFFNDTTIFFDSGTGRGIGTEVRVTDYLGNSLLYELDEYKEKINQFGNYNLGNVDNNYGELYGLYFALLLSKKRNIKRIVGDSMTVSLHWNKEIRNKINLSKNTIDLIEIVRDLRFEFELLGGEIHYISGDFNPADLGFHRK